MKKRLDICNECDSLCRDFEYFGAYGCWKCWYMPNPRINQWVVDFLKKEAFENGEVPDDCPYIVEYTLMEWNKKGEEHVDKGND